MLKNIFEDFERKVMEQQIQVPITITVDVDVGDASEKVEAEPQPVVQPIEMSDEEKNDLKIIAAIDDYFKTLNDGQYSPMSGEHNNASNNTEVFHIAKKHGVDPAKLMQFLSDTAIFDKFQEISAKTEVCEGRIADERKQKFKDAFYSIVAPKRYQEYCIKAATAIINGSISLQKASEVYGIPVDSLKKSVNDCMVKRVNEGKGRNKTASRHGARKKEAEQTKNIGGNPVAKNAGINKGGKMKDKTKYDRKNMKEDVFGKDSPSLAQIADKHNVSISSLASELRKGHSVESEHTTDPVVADEISRDHLGERPKYYSELEKMENKPVKEAGKKPNVARMTGPYRDKHGRKFYYDPVQSAYYIPSQNRYLSGEEAQKYNDMTIPPIDPDRYPNRDHEGLEGPYRNKHGRVYYYDRYKGKYYDSRLDMYLEPEDISEAKQSVLESAFDTYNLILEGKKMSRYQFEVMSLLDSLGIDYVSDSDRILLADPWYTQVLKVYPQYTGVIRELQYESSCGGTSSGSVAGFAKPIGEVIKREEESCEICGEKCCECGK